VRSILKSVFFSFFRFSGTKEEAPFISISPCDLLLQCGELRRTHVCGAFGQNQWSFINLFLHSLAEPSFVQAWCLDQAVPCCSAVSQVPGKVYIRDRYPESKQNNVHLPNQRSVVVQDPLQTRTHFPFILTLCMQNRRPRVCTNLLARSTPRIPQKLDVWGQALERTRLHVRLFCRSPVALLFPRI
jgi:hypothetical protein